MTRRPTRTEVLLEQTGGAGASDGPPPGWSCDTEAGQIRLRLTTPTGVVFTWPLAPRDALGLGRRLLAEALAKPGTVIRVQAREAIVRGIDAIVLEQALWRRVEHGR